MIVFDDGEEFKGKISMDVRSYAEGKTWAVMVHCEVPVPPEVLVAALRGASDTIEKRSCKRRAHFVKAEQYFGFTPKGDGAAK